MLWKIQKNVYRIAYHINLERHDAYVREILAVILAFSVNFIGHFTAY